MEHHRVRVSSPDFFRLSQLTSHVFRTVLSSAGNDGRVRLWKATVGSVWRAAGSIGVEQSEDTQDVDVNMNEKAVAE